MLKTSKAQGNYEESCKPVLAKEIVKREVMLTIIWQPHFA